MKSINSNLKYLNNTTRDTLEAVRPSLWSRIALFRYFVLCILCSAWSIGFNSVSALEYSSSAGLEFTINPSISVSVSGDLIIGELAPGSYSDSNIVDVTVLSNNSTGYVLSSSVGNSTNSYTDLRLGGNSNSNGNGSNNSDNNNGNSNSNENIHKFTNLDSNKASLSNFDDNYWGYSYSTDSGSTWVSGDTGSTSTGYNGLPLYTLTGIKLTDATSTGTNTIQFKIAAKASNVQAAGDYTNIINFMVVGNVVPVSFYDAFTSASEQPGSTITKLNGYYKMQDMTAEICSAVQLYDGASHIQLIDTRDNEVYWIGKLKDNRCWLLDNLRLGSNEHSIDLTPEDTNIMNNYTLSNSVASGWANSYTEAKIATYYKNRTVTNYGTASGKVGAFYNFCALSAGTYCLSENQDYGTSIENDLCPIHWRIPSTSNFATLSNHYSDTTATNNSSFQHNLSTPLSGFAINGGISDLNSRGRFWASAARNNGGAWFMEIYSNSVNVYGWGNSIRSQGFNIRCIANNQ